MSDISSLFLLGLLYGTTTCTITCLPYLSPYLLTTGKGFKEGITSSLTFSFGKLFTYIILGGIAAFLGHTLIPADDAKAKLIQGTIIIITALALPFISSGGCQKKSQIIGKASSLFALGISTSLIPCPPLMTILLVAANGGSVTMGLLYGTMYGLGIVISPIIIMGGILSQISKTVKVEARSFIPYLQGISILIMVVMGVRIII